MNSEDGQVYSWFTTVYIKNINKQNVNIADETLTDYSFLSRYHILNQRIIEKDDIEFVTEFLFLLGHPVHVIKQILIYICIYK